MFSQITERVDDQTLNDGKKDNDDEEEERDVENNAVQLQWIAVGRLQFVADTATRSDARVQVKFETLDESAE